MFSSPQKRLRLSSQQFPPLHIADWRKRFKAFRCMKGGFAAMPLIIDFRVAQRAEKYDKSSQSFRLWLLSLRIQYVFLLPLGDRSRRAALSTSVNLKRQRY